MIVVFIHKQRSLTRAFYFYLFICFSLPARSIHYFIFWFSTRPFIHEVQSSCKGRTLYLSLDTRDRPTKRRSSYGPAYHFCCDGCRTSLVHLPNSWTLLSFTSAVQYICPPVLITNPITDVEIQFLIYIIYIAATQPLMGIVTKLYACVNSWTSLLLLPPIALYHIAAAAA